MYIILIMDNKMIDESCLPGAITGNAKRQMINEQMQLMVAIFEGGNIRTIPDKWQWLPTWTVF